MNKRKRRYAQYFEIFHTWKRLISRSSYKSICNRSEEGSLEYSFDHRNTDFSVNIGESEQPVNEKSRTNRNKYLNSRL